MSTIPFVERLGDAIQAAIADPTVARRRRARRGLVLAVGTLLLLGGSLAAAQLLNEPEKLATGSIGCYQDAAMRGSVTIIWPGDRSPVEACAESFREAGEPVPPLVACAYNGAVAVLPGRDQAVCQRHALEPLPAGYAARPWQGGRAGEGDPGHRRRAPTASHRRSWPPVCSGYWTGRAGPAGRPGCGPTSRQAHAGRCPAWAGAAIAASPAPWTTPAAG